MNDLVVSVIAGGWSFNLMDRNRIPGFIIGANEAGLLPVASECISMDRLWTEHRWPQIRERRKATSIRRSAMQKIDAGQWSFPWLRVYECDHESVEFSEDPRVLNGTNSGLCALNRAYQLRPATVYLFGFDMQRGPKGEIHWHPEYAWRPTGGTGNATYREWSQQFGSAANAFARIGTKVINASPWSAIEVFPKTSDFLLRR